jgi:outer membrane receptor protein involved in Fe transport
VLSTFDVGTIPSGLTTGTGVLNIYAPGVVGFNGSSPLQGATDAYELFGELLVPVLQNLPLIESLNLNLGYRYSQYNTAGNVSSYKADLEYKPISWALFRGGYQRAVRAPSIGELFAPQNNNFPSIGAPTTTGTGGDPCDIRSTWRAGANFDKAAVRSLCLAQGVPSGLVDAFTYPNTQVQTLVGGNPNLNAETADTYSAGVVLRSPIKSPLLQRMTLSLDYYNIKIDGVIGTVGTTTAIDKCFNLQGANPTYTPGNVYCSYFVRDPTTGQILTGNGTNANLGGLKTSGEDIQFDWAFGLGAVGLDDRFGQLNLNVVATHLESYQSNDVPGSPFLEYAGTIGGFGAALPKWKGLTSVTYSVGPVDATFRWQYYDAMRDVSLVGAPAGSTAINAPTISYFDLLGRWRISRRFELRGGVNNLANKQPPTFSTTPQANTDPSAYDVYGRRYFLALRATF